jgi:hypothetical protein
LVLVQKVTLLTIVCVALRTIYTFTQFNKSITKTQINQIETNSKKSTKKFNNSNITACTSHLHTTRITMQKETVKKDLRFASYGLRKVCFEFE